MNVDDNVCVPDVFWQLRVIQRTPVFVPSSLWKKNCASATSVMYFVVTLLHAWQLKTMINELNFYTGSRSKLISRGASVAT